MLKLQRGFIKQLKACCIWHSPQLLQKQVRHISALYITGDKANENYVTLQPYMDFEDTLKETKMLKSSIAARKLTMSLERILEKYEKYKELQHKIKTLEAEREAVVKALKDLNKTGNAADGGTVIKERGKKLRNEMKALKESSYPVEDDFIHAFLNLPNTLHANCPSDDQEKIVYRSATPKVESGKNHLTRKDLIRFLDNSCYYMMEEAAQFDISSMQALTNYFVERGNFIQMANPDFARCVLLEANATPLEDYHLVLEEHLLNKLNCAYLTGGAAFESYLGALTKLCVYPTVLPLRLVSCGRYYHKPNASSASQANLFTAAQTNAVQTLVATSSAIEAEHEMEQILNWCVNFYKELGVHFRIVYTDASALTPAECLRATIEIYSPAQQTYIAVGHVSNYTNFVSKRILFSMRQQKGYHFLHLVGGPVLHTTRLIAALIENDIDLKNCKLLGASKEKTTQTAVEEFKSLFK